MLNHLFHSYETTVIALIVYMSFWFVVSLYFKRNDVADIAWGPGFIVVSGVSLLANHNQSIATLILLGLISVWGLRLGLHIGLRNIKKSEDSRYAAKRQLWTKNFYLQSYLQIFLLQGVLILIVGTPLIVFNTFASGSLDWIILLGLLIWVFGFMFESVADRQLRKFLSQVSNKGKVMKSGLWQYSRHPNYFGELTQWWAIGIIVLSCEYGWLGLIGPVVISYLIIKVSGIPLLEAKYADRPDYQQYKQRTRALFPIPKKG
jgi:steroid 5-alpha reductase family enzyme